MSIPFFTQPVTLVLSIGDTSSCRSNGSPVQFATREYHAMLALFSGWTINCKVYHSTNVVFTVTEKMINEAWEEMDKEKFWWCKGSDVDACIEKYAEGKVGINLPNLYIKETPEEIKKKLVPKEIRVGIRFQGRIAGAQGVTYENTARRTIKVPAQFTEHQAKEAATHALYFKGDDGIAYDNVHAVEVMFN